MKIQMVMIFGMDLHINSIWMGKILWEQEYSAVDSLVELFFNLGLSRDGGFLSWRHQLATTDLWKQKLVGTGGQQRLPDPGCNPVGIRKRILSGTLCPGTESRRKTSMCTAMSTTTKHPRSIFNEWGHRVYSSHRDCIQAKDQSEPIQCRHLLLCHPSRQSKPQSGRFVKIWMAGWIIVTDYEIIFEGNYWIINSMFNSSQTARDGRRSLFGKCKILLFEFPVAFLFDFWFERI